MPRGIVLGQRFEALMDTRAQRGRHEFAIFVLLDTLAAEFRARGGRRPG
jgi:hypothetical protein